MMLLVALDSAVRTLGVQKALAKDGFTPGAPIAETPKYVSFNAYFQDLVGFAVIIAGLLAVLVIVYAGFVYSRSQGQADQISHAKELIAGALTGLALLLLIRLIVPTLGVQVN